MRNNFSTFASVSALTALLTAPVYANSLSDYFEATAGLVPNKLSLSVREEMVYSDNCHNAARGHEDCLSLETSVNAEWTRTIGGMSYGLNGGASYTWYDDPNMRDEDDQFQWYIQPKFLGDFEIFSNDRLSISFAAQSHFTRFDSTNTTKTYYQTYGADVVYDLFGEGRIGGALTFDYDYTYYPRKQFRHWNHSTFEVAANPYYKLTDLTKVGLRLAYAETNYTSEKYQDDSYTETINAFVNTQITRKLAAHAEAGLKRVSYEGASRGSAYDDDWKDNYAANVTYRPMRDLSIKLATAYTPEDTRSHTRGARDSWSNDLTVSWRATSKVTLQQGLNYDVKNEVNGSATDSAETGYRARVNYELNDRVDIYAGYEYTYVHYKYKGYLNYHVNEFILGVKCNF